MSEVVKEFKNSVEKSISFYKEELKGVRTGRASVAMFENIKVDYYGTPTPLTGVASLSAPEPRLVTISPWDASQIPAIEKAIQNRWALIHQMMAKLSAFLSHSLQKKEEKSLLK